MIFVTQQELTSPNPTPIPPKYTTLPSHVFLQFVYRVLSVYVGKELYYYRVFTIIAIIILTVVFLAAEVLCHYYYCYLLLCVNKKELLSFVPSADFDRKSRAIYLLFR